MDDSAVSTLPLTQCPFCDYELIGLPPAGVCPECGKAYDDRFIVLFGFATGKSATIRNGSPRLIARRLLAQLLPLIVIFGILASGQGLRQDPWLIYVVGNSLIPLSITLGMRLASMRQSPSMVILCPQGVAQQDTVDLRGVFGFLTKVWMIASYVLIGSYFLDRVLRVRADSAFILISIVVIAIAIRLGNRQKKANDKIEMPGPGGEPISITPWQHISRAELEPTTAGRFHLKFYRPGARYVADTVYVDADVALDAERADQLREITRQWILNPQPVAIAV